jgi:hypothetical protein
MECADAPPADQIRLRGPGHLALLKDKVKTRAPADALVAARFDLRLEMQPPISDAAAIATDSALLLYICRLSPSPVLRGTNSP